MVRPDSTGAAAPAVPKPSVADAVLVREAGLSFQALANADAGADPFVEWLGLMEVVQMLCPQWPVRDQAMQGQQWKL